MTKYFYTEVVTNNSSSNLHSALEQFVDSNIHKYVDAEQQGGAFTIYLEFRNLIKERCADVTETFVKRFADLQKECSTDWSYLWTLYSARYAGNVGATIIVFCSDDSLTRIMQKIENIQSILPKRQFLADVAIRISGLQPQCRKGWLMGQIPENAELLDCGFFNH